MLPVPAAAGGLLVPAKAQLTTAALREYRELLRKTRSSRSDDSSSSLFEQAKERVLLRLQEQQQRRVAPPRVDPRRALGRMRERLAAARLSLRDLKNEQKERLRQYVASAVAGGGSSSSRVAISSSSSAAAVDGSSAAAALAAAEPAVVAAAGSALDARAAAAAMGSNGLLRHLVIAGVGGACKLFLQAGSSTSVQGQERMAAALARPQGQGLITVSNHVGSIDDPLITTSIMPADTLLDPRAVRWTMCATDRCFKSALLAPFFKAAKVLPVERGAGLSQFGMQLAQSRLAEGEWVHIFPEGTRSRDGRMQPVRKGVGWLVASAAASGGQAPLVLPFVHSGMERVLPKGRALPKLGQELRVLVGEPVPVADLLQEAAAAGWSEQALQVAIADRVGQALYQLKAQLDGLPLEQVAPQPRAAAISISEDTLLPLIEDEMDSLAHRWRDRWQDRWQRLSLPTLTQQMRHTVSARREALRARLATSASAAASASAGSGGSLFSSSDATFEGIAAATEESTGIISGWEHAGAAPLPWGGPTEAEEAAWEAAAAAPASPRGAAASAEVAAWEAAAAAADVQAGPGLLARHSLRLLRGGRTEPGSTVSSSSGGEGSGGGIPACSGRPDFVVASPLDTIARVAGGSSTSGGTAPSTSLAALLAAATDYSAARVQHMRQLLQTQHLRGASVGSVAPQGAPAATFD